MQQQPTVNAPNPSCCKSGPLCLKCKALSAGYVEAQRVLAGGTPAANQQQQEVVVLNARGWLLAQAGAITMPVVNKDKDDSDNVLPTFFPDFGGGASPALRRA